MKLNIGRSPQPVAPGAEPTVVIVSGACCFPPLKALDNEARRIVDAAIVEAGVPARVISMSSAQAYYGGLPRDIAEEGKKKKDEVGISMFPVVLVNLEPVSYGVPTPDAVVAALTRSTHDTPETPAAAAGDAR